MTTAAGSPRVGEIRKVASVGFLKDLFGRMGAVHMSAFAAGLAYGAIFAIVPMLALLVSLLGIFNATDLVAKAMDQLGPVLPADAVSLIKTQLLSVATTDSSGAFGVGAIVSALVALWGASGAMRRVMEALNVVHGADETRPFVRKYLVSFGLAIGAILILTATLLVMVVGGDAASRVFAVVGLGDTAETVWAWVRWPALLALAWLGIASAYRFAPAARQTGGILTPGTLFATFGWVGFSALFSWYVGGVGSMSATWGSVAGIVVFLLYLQYAGMIVLLGALVDVVLFDRDRPTSRVRRFLRRPATKS
ncbi:MAG: putative ribonuclease [Thermoleophilia bacterium]|nr:putative ribonuclease [Thermoleophilia bacterium]